jgi:hypothetical protein
MTSRLPSKTGVALFPLLCSLSLTACTLDSEATGEASTPQDAALGPDAQAPDAEVLDAAQLDAGNGNPKGSDASISKPDAGQERDAGDAAANEGDASVGDADAGLEFPALLSETGLYRDIALELNEADVRSFAPRYALWSDGAQKRRWFKLPKGKQIDTSDMDAWRFPVGTKAWKEFASQGVRVETRLIHKVSETRWVMVAYRWREDQSDADALPAGEDNALGTNHDVPSAALCERCHGDTGEPLLGVSAIQLSHEQGGETLLSLKAMGLLSDPPAIAFQIPGGSAAEKALGYLHANCGHCHRPGTAAYLQILKREPKTGGPILWERTDALDSLEQTLGYRSTVGRPNSVLPDLHIIEPGLPEESELVIRISQRGAGSLQMPPVGTERVDGKGLRQVKDWVLSLKPKHVP